MPLLSKWSRTVMGHYPRAAFDKILLGCALERDDLSAFIRTHILEGIPKAFIKYPIIFDVIRCFVSKNLGVSPNDVCMTGSAKLGFSLKSTQWLNKYLAGESDLDLFIVSDELFRKLEREFNIWNDEYISKTISPANDTEARCWANNIKRLPTTIERGLINPDHIPPQRYKWAGKCREVCDRLPKYTMEAISGTGIVISTKPGTLRVYSNRSAAIKQIAINIDDSIRKAKIAPQNNRTFGTPLDIRNCRRD